MLKTPGNRVVFSGHPKDLDQCSKVAVWGDGSHLSVVQQAESRGIDILRMEDGFVRSVGLGSNLVRPLSLVLDSRGIYFDPTRPSDLETLLWETVFTEDLTRQVAALHQRIVSERFSKYNVGDDAPLSINAVPGQSVLLVPGQVEDDASIQLKYIYIRTNQGLLTEVASRTRSLILFTSLILMCWRETAWGVLPSRRQKSTAIWL